MAARRASSLPPSSLAPRWSSRPGQSGIYPPKHDTQLTYRNTSLTYNPPENSIFKPTKPATQSGDNKGRVWRMDWDVQGKGHRWENQLMGWQSSADAMQGTHLNFKSKEDAIAFAEKQGYEYYVQEPNVRHFTPKAYANNFLYSPNKLKMVRTK